MSYGTRVVASAPSSDPYGQRYKGIWICLDLLKTALAGNYVNFGVFELYGDPALKVYASCHGILELSPPCTSAPKAALNICGAWVLASAVHCMHQGMVRGWRRDAAQNSCMMVSTECLSGTRAQLRAPVQLGAPVQDALDMTMKMALSVPLADIMAYRKVGKAYFGLLDVLCSNHTHVIANYDTPTFAFLMTALDSGLKSLDTVISSQCATAVDNLAGFYFKAVQANGSETPPAAAQVVPQAVTVRWRARLCSWGIKPGCGLNAWIIAVKLMAQIWPSGKKLVRVWCSASVSMCALGECGWDTSRDAHCVGEGGPVLLQKVAEHLQQRPELLPTLLTTLFEIVLFEDCPNQWSLSRPMLSLILINEQVLPGEMSPGVDKCVQACLRTKKA